MNAITGAFRRSYCLVGNEQDWSTCTTGFTFCMSSAVFADNTRMFIASYSSNEVSHRRAPGRSWEDSLVGSSHMPGHSICGTAHFLSVNPMSWAAVAVPALWEWTGPQHLRWKCGAARGPCVLAVTV